MSQILVNPYAFGGGPPTALTFIGTHSVADSTTLPLSSILAGDLLILLWVAEGGSVWAAPSGWTNIGSRDDSHEQGCAFNVAAGGETSITIPGGSDWNEAIVLQFRGNNPISSAVAASYVSAFTSGNPGAGTITAASGTPPLVVVGSLLLDGGEAPEDRLSTGSTGIGSFTASQEAHYCYKIYNSSPANTGIDIGDSGGYTGYQGFYVQVS